MYEPPLFDVGVENRAMRTEIARLSLEVSNLTADNRRLREALDIARTALLNIERRSEEGRAALSTVIEI